MKKNKKTIIRKKTPKEKYKDSVKKTRSYRVYKARQQKRTMTA